MLVGRLVGLATVMALAAACSGPNQPPVAPARPSGGQTTAPTAASSSSSVAAPGAASPSPTAAVAGSVDPDWLTYQHDLGRSGQTGGAYNPAGMHQLWQSDPLDARAYGQVIVNSNDAFAVTQNNTVYALDASTGRVEWSRHLGDPVPRSALACGDVDPTGILSTPA